MKGTPELLRDMLDAINAIEGYASSSYEEFVEDEKTQDAIMFNLVVLGEAANRIPADFQAQHSKIPWSSIIGTRNIIVHGYDQVKLRIVWDIIQKDLHSLREALQHQL
jgi:uncharacterized protein with HEPN domain